MPDPSYVNVSDGVGDTPATDMRLSQVPEVVAFLGMAVLESLAVGDGWCERDDFDGSLMVTVTVWHPRPRLLWLLQRAGVPDVLPSSNGIETTP